MPIRLITLLTVSALFCSSSAWANSQMCEGAFNREAKPTYTTYFSQGGPTRLWAPANDNARPKPHEPALVKNGWIETANGPVRSGPIGKGTITKGEFVAEILAKQEPILTQLPSGHIVIEELALNLSHYTKQPNELLTNADATEIKREVALYMAPYFIIR